jgi:glucosamine--fructose-6-phosphate aminotransferase (isomerizing)
MCGIFGYVGTPVQVGPMVLEALRSMEYRGYDSWGVAYVTPGTPGKVIKGVGRVVIDAAGDARASSAIGHTRWATHGEVSERNAHPHLGSSGRIAVVHNGIIEPVDALRADVRSGTPLASDTDSELMAHLVERYLGDQGALTSAVDRAFSLIEGNNAFVVLDRDSGEIVVVTRRLPIRLSRAGDALVLASDPAALAGVVTTTVAVPDNTAVSLGAPNGSAEDALRLLATGRPIAVPDRRIAHEGGPGTSMRAEIAEQPALLRRIAGDREAITAAAELARQATRVVFTGCGSASHAAMYAADLLMEGSDRIGSVAIPASEILGRPSLIHPGDVVVALTQSGETADGIDAVTIARERGASCIGLINAEGSSVEHLVDVAVPLLAGHERSVLATKSYIAMLARAAQLVDVIVDPEIDSRALDLAEEADLLDRALADRRIGNWVSGLAATLAERSSAMVVTSGIHMPVGYEAALKIKEGSYVHAEAVRTGELKHGVIALIDDGFPCVLMTPDTTVAGRLRIAAEELRSRGASIYWAGPDAPVSLERGASGTVIDIGSPFVQTVLMQLVALETALMRGVDPDYPRNLAKSVTVR